MIPLVIGVHVNSSLYCTYKLQWKVCGGKTSPGGLACDIFGKPVVRELALLMEESWLTLDLGHCDTSNPVSFVKVCSISACLFLLFSSKSAFTSTKVFVLFYFCPHYK